jgi:hypothetical protein
LVPYAGLRLVSFWRTRNRHGLWTRHRPDSGKHEGKPAVRGGRSDVPAILFVVASVVRRYDPDFAAFHQRLSAAGKPKKSSG